MDEILIDWLALLLVPGLGVRTAHVLLERFGSPSEIFKAKPRDLIANGVHSDCITGIINSDIRKEAAVEIRRAEKLNATIIPLPDPRYPKLLREIYDPPIVIYSKGDLDIVNRYPCIAVVGTRTPSAYGVEAADRLAADLANSGITVISGLARGIDAVSHRGALSVKGHTAAVLGNGIDVIYPKENRKLTEQIIAEGALISEFPLGTYPAPQNFPIRNRIISGLSLGTVIVEASEYSGSLITARMALEQNREVFAVPGNITSGKSFGPNYLIKQGAKLIQYWRDVVDELPYAIREALLTQAGGLSHESRELPLMSEPENEILNLLRIEQAQHIDKLVEKTKLDLSALNEALLGLEMKGMIRQLPGKNFVRKWVH